MSSTSTTTPSDSLLEAFKKPVPSQPIKRHAACYQCRKRKLKCDARRPCSTCVRAHAYLVDHPPPGVQPPAHPSCSYNEESDDEDHREGNDEGYKKLESRISELEAMLRDTTIELQSFQISAGSSPASSGPNDSHASSPAGHSTEYQDRSSPGRSTYQPNGSQSPPSLPNSGIRDISPTQDTTWMTGSSLTDLLAAATSGIASGNTYESPYQNQNTSTPTESLVTNQYYGDETPSRNVTYSSASYGSGDIAELTNFLGPSSSYGRLANYDFEDYEIAHTGWSPHLPDPATTRHLVQAFLAFHIHAGRLFHGPTFLASLDLHPMDERFPSVAVLHALCAVGSLYVAEITPTPVHTDSGFPYVVFHGRWRRIAARPDSFAEQQAKLAHRAINQFFEAGDHLVSVLQAQVLLTWWYTSQARWSESFVYSGRMLRSCIPLGLSTTEPFKARQRGSNPGPIIQDPTILPLPSNIIEEENRRNIFWLAYAMERHRAATGSFAMELDDLDINQMLPVRGDQFELGTKVPVENRQFSNDKGILTNHPPQQTDSFVLYIKSAMIISRVKTFNTRYKGRYHSGDLALFSTMAPPPNSIDELDPRDTPAFKEVDELVTSWKDSLPQQYRTPVQDETVDPHLYSVLISTYLATILLHDPFVDLKNPMCPSANKVIQAARGILDQMYLISSTTYDVSLLDQICISGWYFAGRVLIRFLNAALRNTFVEHVVVLHGEVSYIYSMLSKAGERMTIAYRYKRILLDVLVNTCGEQFVEPPAADSPHTYIAPVESAQVERAPRNLLNALVPAVHAAAGGNTNGPLRF
ncbi:hypothetical protein BDW22DRAFT_1363876 [Trametopsis cervina]|nr:hypothetical protein BDW22DRAFT_1363876 [Trametopsis cervina]